MDTKRLVIIAMCVSVLCSCRTPDPIIAPSTPAVTIGLPDDCPIAQPNWNNIQVGITADQKVDLLSELLTAFQANNDNTASSGVLNAEGKLTANFKNTFNQTINSLDSRSYRISDDLQELIVAGRVLACDIHAGTYTGPNRIQAEQNLLEIRKDVLSLKKKVEQN